MSNFIDLKNFKGSPFELYENNNVYNKKNNMTGTLSKNNINQLFFSQSNIDLLQDSIIKGVFDTSNFKIQKQSEDELIIIMRSLYFQYGKNLDYNIQSQIYELNEHVLKYCIPNINSSIKQYNGYINDITKQQDLIEMPKSVNTKGDKTLMPRYFI